MHGTKKNESSVGAVSVSHYGDSLFSKKNQNKCQNQKITANKSRFWSSVTAWKKIMGLEMTIKGSEGKFSTE